MKILALNGSRRKQGNTLTLLTDFARDIGLVVTDSIKALRCVESDSIRAETDTLRQAEHAGQELVKRLRK